MKRPRSTPRPRDKSRLFEQVARVGRAIGSGPRLELLELLAQGERSVERLAEGASLSVANTSHHLRVLREAGLVANRKAGLRVIYQLRDPDVFTLARLARTLANRHLIEVSRIVNTYLGSRDQFAPVAQEELLARARAGTVLVLDVRPEEEYAAGHIPGAVSIPVAELEARIRTLPRGVEIVAYCRGPWCVMAYQAVEMLRAGGHRARRLEEGFPEWRAAGLPIATPPAEAASCAF